MLYYLAAVIFVGTYFRYSKLHSACIDLIAQHFHLLFCGKQTEKGKQFSVLDITQIYLRQGPINLCQSNYNK